MGDQEASVSALWRAIVMWYVLWFLVGCLASIPYSSEQINSALNSVWVLMLVALFASLLVPFAAFSRRERFNRLFLMYAPLIAFGAYGMMVYRDPTIIHGILMVASMGMHLSYWTSGIHSRAYRMEQWRTAGFDRSHPNCSRIIAYFNATGRSEMADELVQKIFSRTQIQGELQRALMNCPHCEEEQVRSELGTLLPQR